ncbi:hypothetical protein D3C83_177840 [compost metagenome]
MGEAAERLALELLARVAGHLAEGAVHVPEDPLRADHDEPDGGALERLPYQLEL